MKICLIRPGLSDRDFLHKEGVNWKAARFIFNKISRLKVGMGSEVPPLSLMVLAALTPLGNEITIVDEEIQEIDFDYDFDIVGITILTTTAYRGYEIADQFRKRGVKVVLGGIHATVLPEEATQHADAVVIGEAEGVWHQVLADAKTGKLQRYYKNRTYCDMKKMPVPRRDLLTENSYLTTNLIQTTRGCPNRCSFCSIHAISGNTFRRRPISDVISELKTFSSPIAAFVDDNIIGSPKYAKELFKAMIPMKIQWWGQASLKITEDEELLSLASKSGCKIMVIGFESLCEDNIRSIGKTRTNKVSDYKEAIKKLHNYGICIEGSFIIGLDNDNSSVFDRTIEFIQANNIDLPLANVLIPWPGTRVFKEFEAERRIIHKNWRLYGKAFGKSVFHPKLMTPEELSQGHLYIGRQIYSLGAVTKRMLSIRNNLAPIIAFNLKQRSAYS